MADGRVVYQIVGDTSKLSEDMKGAEGIIRAETGKWDGIAATAAEKIGSAFKTAITAAAVAIPTAATAALTAVTKTGIEYNNNMDRYQRMFTTFLGDEKEAEKIMGDIAEYAAITPFDVDSLTQAVQMLVAADVPAEEALNTILALGDAIAATGGSSDALSRMAANLQQVSNVGKASAVDVKQFAMAGINIYKILADYTGKTTEQLQEQDITYDMISEALQQAASEGGRYYGGMISQSETLTGKVSTLKDTFSQFAGRVTEDLIPAGKDVVGMLTDLLNNSGDLEPKIKGIFSAIAEHISAAVEKVGNFDEIFKEVTEKFSAFQESASGVVEPLKALGGDILTNVKARAGELKTELKPLAEEGFQKMKEAVEVVKPQLEEFGSTVLEKLKNGVAEMDEKLQTIIPNLREMGGELLTKIKDKADGLKEKFEPLVNDVITAAKEKLDEVMPHLRELGERILGNIENSLQNIKSPSEIIAEKVLPLLAENMPKIIELLTGLAENVLLPIVEYITQLSPKLQNLADKIMPSLSSLVGKVLDFLKKLVNDVAPPIIQFVSDITDPLIHFVETVLPPLLELVGNILDVLGTLASKILPPILDAVKGIFQHLEPLASTILADIIGFAKQIAEKAGEFIEKIAPVVEAVGEVAVAFTDLLVSVLQPLWDFIQPIIEQALGQLLDLLGEIISKIADGLIVVLNDMKAEIGRVKSAFETLGKFLSGDFEGAWEDVMNFVDKLTNDTMESIKQAISEALSVISSGVQKIKTVLGGVGSTIGALLSGEIGFSEIGDYFNEVTSNGSSGRGGSVMTVNSTINQSDDIASGLVGAYKAGLENVQTRAAERAAGGSASSSSSGSGHGVGGTKVEVNTTIELDGDVVARNTYSRLDDYVGSEVRGTG